MIKLALGWCAVACLVEARSSYPNRLPNSRNVKDDEGNALPAGLGHTNLFGGGARNQFGLDFARVGGFQWNQALCELDSDGDGRTNGEELGDPNCVWSVGQAPELTVDITHPGVANTFDKNKNKTEGPELVFPPLPSWVVAHISMAVIGCAIAMPLGVLVPVVFRRFQFQTGFVFAHAGLVSVGIICGLIAYALGVSQVSDPLKTVHGKVGTVLLVLWAVQWMLGALRPHKAKPDETTSLERWWFELIHPNLGRLLVILISVQFWFGYSLLNQNFRANQDEGLRVWSYVHVIGFTVVYFAIYIALSLGTEPANDKNSTFASSPKERAPAVV